MSTSEPDYESLFNQIEEIDADEVEKEFIKDNAVAVAVVMTQRRWEQLADSAADVMEILDVMNPQYVVKFLPMVQVFSAVMEVAATKGRREKGWFTNEAEG